MRSQRLHIGWLVVAAAAALVAAALVSPVAARPAPEPAFVPGVTDSSTGVLRELERRGFAAEEFIPGVTDSTTGVARDLERRGFEPRPIPPAATVDDSGFQWDDPAIGTGAVLAAAVLTAAFGALVTARRFGSD